MKEPIASRFYKEIVNTISDGLLVVSEEGTIQMVNPAMERMTGFSGSELVGSPCSVLNCDVCETARSKSKKRWCMLFERGAVKAMRCMLMRKDGSYVSAVKNATLLKDSRGKVLGALETFIDVSEIDKRDRKIHDLSRLLNAGADFCGMVGASPAMQRVYQVIERAAQFDTPVVIYGESGTGKELAAHAIHQLGRRRNGPFIQLNCAALNEALLESELFGHTKGAFTGAYRHRMGRFEAAHGGDIFLDEIGEMPMSMQTKLLRVFETRQFERVGDHRPISVDTRIITATNRNLHEMVAAGIFRQDLFFRVNVVPVHLPPLRERKEDIPLLAGVFIHRLRTKMGSGITGVSPEVMSFFMHHKWPGNVRELKSTLEYACVIADSGLIELCHLPGRLQTGSNDGSGCNFAWGSSRPSEEPEEKKALIEALRLSNGSRTKAAKILGVHRMTVWNRMKRYGIHSINKIEP